MPDRGRGVYCALARGGLIAALLACLATEGHAKGHDAKKGVPTDQRGTAQAPLVVETYPAPKTSEEAAAEKKDRDEQLANDRNMVVWTRVLASIGALQLIVFGYQAYKLRQTVADSKDAIAASQRSAKAAEDSLAKSDEMLAHSREAAERSHKSGRRIERAYVFPGLNADAWLVGPYGWRLNLGVKNYGKTPAFIKLIKAEFSFTEPVGAMIIGASREWDMDIVLSAMGEQISAIELPLPHGYLCITIGYTDIFDERWFSRAIYRIDATIPTMEDGAVRVMFQNTYWNEWS